MSQPETIDLLVTRVDWVVTMDANRRLLRNGSVAIVNDRIVSVGNSAELEARYVARTTIDGRGKVLLPGLINAHVHNTQQLARGLADDCGIERWLVERIYPFEAAITEEEARVSALACQLEMIKNGISTYIDPGGYYPDQTAEVTAKTGLRGIITRSTLDLHSSAFGPIPTELTSENTAEALREGEELVTRWHDSLAGRLRVWFGLRTMRNCSDDLCRGIKKLADRYGVGIQAHVLGSHGTIWASLSRFGRTDVERLHRIGVLGPNWLMIHTGWLSPLEVRLLRQYDVKVAHCPAAGMHGASGRNFHGAFAEMLQTGVCVALGTDSAPEGNFNDLVRNMFLACCAPRDQYLDAQIMPAETALEMATRNGARAALWDDAIGSIEVGKKADLVLFDARRPEWQPLHDPVSTLVYSATGSSADTLIVDGKILMRHREVLTIDEKDVLGRAQAAAESIAERSGLKRLAIPRWPVS